MRLFKNKTKENINKEKLVDTNKKESQEEMHNEEYIWIEGFKGTDKDMICSGEYIKSDYCKKFSLYYPYPSVRFCDECELKEKCKNYVYYYQKYELNREYETNGEIQLCENGFHLCTELESVYNFYDYNFSNRFFKVKALVKKSDYENRNDYKKIVAKRIIFIEEITYNYDYFEKLFTNTYKNDFIKEYFENGNIKSLNDYNLLVKKLFFSDMNKYGYGESFSMILENNIPKEKTYNDSIFNILQKAKAFYEEGLSKDMSVYFLLKEIKL